MKILFVTGLPRAGTTIIQRTLCESYGSSFLPEASFMVKVVEDFLFVKNKSDPFRFQAFFGTQSNCIECYRRTIDAHFEALITASEGEVGNGSVCVLKDPMLSLYLPDGLEIFPDSARFLVILRDPRAVYSSWKRVRMKSKFLMKLRFLFDFRLIKKFYKSLASLQKLELVNVNFLKYEDFVQWDKSNWEDYLSSKLLPSIEHQKIVAREFDKGDPTYSDLYEKPLTDERLNSWRTELNILEKYFVDIYFADAIKNWSYGK